MKTLKITTALGVLLFAASTAQAQVSVNVNIGTPPVWGPQVNANIEYYFLPDIDVYYDIRATQYVYLNRGRWIRSRNLPAHCRDYDLHHGRTIVINDYHGRTPYMYHDKHVASYGRGYEKKPKKYAYDDRHYDKHYDKKHNNHNHRKDDYKGKGHEKHRR